MSDLGYFDPATVRRPDDDYAAWRAALSGESPPCYADMPWCGYFKMRDRRGLNLGKAANKRPVVACAIWRGEDGELRAEFAKSPVPVDRVWPWCAKHPVSYEDYAHWHRHEKWPGGNPS